jgi:hypothetical protein
MEQTFDVHVRELPLVNVGFPGNVDTVLQMTLSIVTHVPVYVTR